MATLRTISVVAALLAPCVSNGEERALPVPRLVIYPGDVIHDNMLEDATADLETTLNVIVSRSDVVGLVAKRTLFPGRPINLSSTEIKPAVANGSLVQLVYELPGLSISASGLALQTARTGEPIRVRNSDSGLVVTGVVSSAGTVLVGR